MVKIFLNLPRFLSKEVQFVDRSIPMDELKPARLGRPHRLPRSYFFWKAFLMVLTTSGGKLKSPFAQASHSL